MADNANKLVLMYLDENEMIQLGRIECATRSFSWFLYHYKI